MEYDNARQKERERTAEEDERRLARGDDKVGLPDTASLEEDLRKNRSGADRRMLQTIFDSSPDFEVGIDEVAVDNDGGDGTETESRVGSGEVTEKATDRMKVAEVTEKKDGEDRY